MVCFSLEKSGFSLEVKNFTVFRWKLKWFFVRSRNGFSLEVMLFFVGTKWFFVGSKNGFSLEKCGFSLEISGFSLFSQNFLLTNFLHELRKKRHISP